MAQSIAPQTLAGRLAVRMRSETGTFVMVAVIAVLGFYLLFPVVLMLVLSFNTADDFLVPPIVWGLENWTSSFDDPRILRSLWNTFILWFFNFIVSFPLGIAIALILARTRIPFTHGLEYLFWISYVFPALANTIGWIMLLDPDVGMINKALVALPFIDQGPFNIYSFWGIVWTKLQSDSVSYFVILLTPAFRNMDQALEEAARIAGASKMGAIFRVTLPVMIGPVVLVLALQLLRIFSGFETEWILGAPWGFFVYSTLIFSQTSQFIPQYGSAIVLASITMLIIGVIFPMQRWIVHRRQYTTITGTFRPGLIDIGKWRWVFLGFILFLLAMFTALPFVVIIIGSFMSKVGFFNAVPTWTTSHWVEVFTDSLFMRGLRTTTILAFAAGIGSPVLFSIIAYLLVRTRWRFRRFLDGTIWVSAVFPGVISGLGLLLMFLTIPGLRWMYGSIWALILVVLISGNTTGTNIFKGVMIQLGGDVEEAARVAGAGWFRTYFTIVLPLLMPTLVLIGMLNFIAAAGTTSSIILLASRDTITLSILGLEWASADLGRTENAGIISLVIMVYTLLLALVGRFYALKMGIRHDRVARKFGIRDAPAKTVIT
ncbi:MAG: iron ABC transporter permease [Gemmatimonadetes bacterium]|nr:iron ABC transporter permease [Gemmatimonadota bacterium]